MAWLFKNISQGIIFSKKGDINCQIFPNWDVHQDGQAKLELGEAGSVYNVQW